METNRLSQFEMLYIDIEQFVETQIKARKKNLLRLSNVLFYPTILTLLGLWLFSVFITFPYIAYLFNYLPANIKMYFDQPFSFVVATIISLILPVIVPFCFSEISFKINNRFHLPNIIISLANTIIILPLWILFLDAWLFPLLIGRYVDFIGTAILVYQIIFIFFLSTLIFVYFINMFLTNVTNFFWVLPTNFQPKNDPYIPDILVYVNNMRGIPRLPSLIDRATIAQLRNEIQSQQSFCDSKAQSLGGITSTLGLIGIGLSFFDTVSTTSLFDSVAVSLNDFGVISQDVSFRLSNTLEGGIILVIFAIIFVLLRGLVNVYQKIYVLEVMDNVCIECAKLIPEVTSIEEPPKASGLWAAIRRLIR